MANKTKRVLEVIGKNPGVKVSDMFRIYAATYGDVSYRYFRYTVGRLHREGRVTRVKRGVYVC